jgi:hypothetical protein
LPFRKRKHSCDESWSASEVTLRPAAKTDLTSASVSASQPMDEPDVPIGDDGLPLQYQITRRNPKRRARPSSRMAE